jgi:hypothetical protein
VASESSDEDSLGENYEKDLPNEADHDWVQDMIKDITSSVKAGTYKKQAGNSHATILDNTNNAYNVHAGIEGIEDPYTRNQRALEEGKKAQREEDEKKTDEEREKSREVVNKNTVVALRINVREQMDKSQKEQEQKQVAEEGVKTDEMKGKRSFEANTKARVAEARKEIAEQTLKATKELIEKKHAEGATKRTEEDKTKKDVFKQQQDARKDQKKQDEEAFNKRTGEEKKKKEDEEAEKKKKKEDEEKKSEEGRQKRAPLVNLARHASCTQSSCYGGWCCDKVVDGNTAQYWWQGSCMHTHYDHPPWVQVDLGTNVWRVEKVVVWNRQDDLHRINPFFLQMRDRNGNSVATQWYHSVQSIYTWERTQENVRYVRLQLGRSEYLIFAELQVFGRRKVT